MAEIEDVLRVERIETDIYRGGAFESQLQRTFGGQVAGQALVSATRTVSDEFSVHSLHGYFLRPGNPDIPAVFLVDRIRDGRSFVTRRVTGIQNGEAIFTMSASFHVTTDEGIEHQDPIPPAPAPEDLPDRHAEAGDDEKAVFKEWDNFDIRIVPADKLVTSPFFVAQQRVWFRYRKPLPDDQTIHVCTLAYMALQRWGDDDPDSMAAVAREWADGPCPLLARAAVAAICEPRLLRTPEMAAHAIDVCERATDVLRAVPDARRRAPDTRTLRKGLGYGWSVAVAADPDAGLPVFDALSQDVDPDVAWVVRSNLGKARLKRIRGDR